MNDDNTISRRTFVRTIAGGAAAAAVAGSLHPFEVLAESARAKGILPRRPLGKTGYRVGIYSLGGQATLETPEKADEAAAIINRALDLGINYIDTAAAYGKGISENYIGRVMNSRRKETFLASKTHDRTYDGSMRLLEQSLKHLQTDHLDLWQVHNVRTEEDLQKMFADDGVVKALEKARSEKMVRFVGITGHRDPFILRTGIERYNFDTILMALNAADRHQSSFIENLLPVAQRQGMGIIGMKIPARGKIFREGGITTMQQALSYVLTLPVSTTIVGISTVQELEQNVEIARNFKPLSPMEMRHLEELTKPYVAEASFFKQQW